MYKADLNRFQKLRTAVRKRYQEDIDFKQYEERVRKLLDTHIHASEVTTLTAAVNIFDEEAFNAAVEEQGTPASKADMIASVTKRTITERMAQDPVFYERLSKLIQQAIDDHKARRISELEYLQRVRAARDEVVRPRYDDVPEEIRNNDNAVAFFHAIQEELEKLGRAHDVTAISSETARELLNIVEGQKVVNWTEREEIQNDMRNDMDDYLFDVLLAKKGLTLSVDVVDAIVDRVLAIARSRLAA
jgi:type I restriction enzyme R subunit